LTVGRAEGRVAVMPDDRPVPPGLEKFWTRSVAQFAELEPNVFSDAQKERHRIYSLLLLALIYGKWNGNKYGEVGDYRHWREGQRIGTTADRGHVYGGGTYQGHNIAALAVDGEGRIVDFDFNHNAAFDSTVEHAESRLVRRLFALNQIYSPWFALDEDSSRAGTMHARRQRQRRQLFATAASNRPAPPRTGTDPVAEREPTPPQGYTTLLKDVTVYTSLESCAQCSGIMCLGSVKEVVYLQWDQGQFLIGNMMWQATTAEQQGFIAPRPVRGDEFGFEYFSRLNAANEAFSQAVKTDAFYVGADASGRQVRITTPGVTTFLCTDEAKAIYADADRELRGWVDATFADHCPAESEAGLTNQEVLTQARDFREWVAQLDNRGAAHRV
jgi:Cytidine and deoxycytidylate deaminase zinc-binding region